MPGVRPHSGCDGRLQLLDNLGDTARRRYGGDVTGSRGPERPRNDGAERRGMRNAEFVGRSERNAECGGGS